MTQKKMIVFYIEEDDQSSRMDSHCISYDGVKAYSSRVSGLYQSYNKVIETIKTQHLMLQEDTEALQFIKWITERLPHNVKTIYECQLEDNMYLGLGIHGYALGTLTVDIKEI